MTSKAKTTLASVIFGVAVCLLTRAEDWPQYRGPDHDGHSSEKILESWPGTGLRAVWKVPLSDGFSSFAVSSGKAFTLVARDVDGAQQEVCVALDLGSGKEIWAAALGIAKYDGGGNSGARGNQGGDGPRSTPAVNDGRVYTMSARLVLSCFDADSGKLIWSKDIVKENEGQKITWQNAASPVLDGDLVFVMGGGPGQALMAFNQKDGRLAWKGQDDKMTHSTPTVATILGVRQVIFFTQNGLVGMETKTGKLLWRYPFRYSTSTAITPVVSGDMIYCSAGYGVGASVCKITKNQDGFAATQLWFEPANVLNSHWSTPVCRDGYIYGLFGTKQFARAPLECVELATGKIMWSHPDFGPGGCALVDGHVLVLSDAGDLALVKADPKAYVETARSHAVDGKCWSSPAVSNGHIYARSTREGACLDVAP